MPLLGAVLTLALGACASEADAPDGAASTGLPPASVELATPAADQPAAGICAEPQGETVTLTLRLDVPDPRCAVVSGVQQLEFRNDTGMELEASLGSYTFTLEPGGTARLESPIAAFLAPGGVHYLSILQPDVGSPAIWFKE